MLELQVNNKNLDVLKKILPKNRSIKWLEILSMLIN